MHESQRRLRDRLSDFLVSEFNEFVRLDSLFIASISIEIEGETQASVTCCRLAMESSSTTWMIKP